MKQYERWAEKNLDVRQRSGDQWLATCVWHDDHKPSLSINVRKGVFYCFSCHESGGWQKLTMKVTGKAMRVSMGLDEMEAELQAINGDVEPEDARTYPDTWLTQFRMSEEALDYLTVQRKLTVQTIVDWGLGYDQRDNSVTIPLRDTHGRVLGVVRRRLDKDRSPRYLYPKGLHIGWILFGAYRLAPLPDGPKKLAIVEGSMDCLSCWQADIPAVALLGSRLSPHQASLIRRLDPQLIVAATDNDAAGREAADAIEMEFGASIPVVMFKYPLSGRYKDPASMPTPLLKSSWCKARSIE